MKTTKLIIGNPKKLLKRTEKTSMFLIFGVIILYFTANPSDEYMTIP